MNGVVSEIGPRYEPTRADLFLETQIPLVNLHVRSVIVQRRHERISRPARIVVLKVSSVGQREGISPGLIGPWILETHIIPKECRKERRSVTEALQIKIGGMKKDNYYYQKFVDIVIILLLLLLVIIWKKLKCFRLG